MLKRDWPWLGGPFCRPGRFFAFGKKVLKHLQKYYMLSLLVGGVKNKAIDADWTIHFYNSLRNINFRSRKTDFDESLKLLLMV